MCPTDIVYQYQSQRQLLIPDLSELGGELGSNSAIDESMITMSPEIQPSSDEENIATIAHGISDKYRAYDEPAPQRIHLNPHDTSLIITGKRNRRQASNRNVFTIQTHVMALGALSLSTYLNTFAAETSKYEVVNDVPNIHHSQLPPPPKHYKALEKHIFGKQFKQAVLREWSSLSQKGCFRRTKLTKATADAGVLPSMWVFTYKTSKTGYLTSFKARLVIRGDLQEPFDDIYAATLAIRNFHALVSIANYFDLELKQYDIPTAFLNAKLNRKLYAETPDGLKSSERNFLEVLLALYGLKESPLLWYETLKRSLIELGLRTVPGFPCLYTNSWLILFVCVDDIAMAYPKSNEHLHREFEQKIVKTYDLKVLGNLEWFHGIRVNRDHAVRKLWLVQDAYIDKVSARFNIQNISKVPDIPLTENWLPQSVEEPDKNRIKFYQQLVGSLAYTVKPLVLNPLIPNNPSYFIRMSGPNVGLVLQLNPFYLITPTT
ncbi:hypothetical protein K3495_g10934 [Podosphaera aphanis]|nr:hypothetical protein K3495_g10934 [Podosphaera aphanis]